MTFGRAFDPLLAWRTKDGAIWGGVGPKVFLLVMIDHQPEVEGFGLGFCLGERYIRFDCQAFWSRLGKFFQLEVDDGCFTQGPVAPRSVIPVIPVIPCSLAKRKPWQLALGTPVLWFAQGLSRRYEWMMHALFRSKHSMGIQEPDSK